MSLKISPRPCGKHKEVGVDHGCRDCVVTSINATLGRSNKVQSLKISPKNAEGWPQRFALLPCIYEGRVRESCTKCNKIVAENNHVRECDHPALDIDGCTRGNDKSASQMCLKCAYRVLQPSRPPYAPGEKQGYGLDGRHGFPLKYTYEQLAPEIGAGPRFNTSIIKYRDRTLCAYRTRWAGGEIHVNDLDDQFNVIGQATHLASLRDHPAARAGAEDPRLFIFRDRLHIAFAGVIPKADGSGPSHTNVLYARLSDDFKVEEVFHPEYPQRNHWEKNWAFFEYHEELYCVYTIFSHRILRIDGNRAELAYDTVPCLMWEHGEPRGGASPIRVGDQYWHWFHFRDGRRYGAGVYTFDAEPPFAIRRFNSFPLLMADTTNKPAPWHVYVEFPCGAIRRPEHGDWLISSGVHDHWTELRRYEEEAVLKDLRGVAPPHGWSWIGEPQELPMWAAIHSSDEYRVRGDDGIPGGNVLDVGAHCGTFTYLMRVLGAARIHAYEPSAIARKHLIANVDQIPGVTVYPEAVGGINCRGIVCKKSEESTSDFVVYDAKGDVKVIPLDDMIDRIGDVALLKLDCEGAEYAALEFCTQLHRVRRIVGEFHRGQEKLLPPLARAGFTVQIVQGSDHSGGWFFADRGGVQREMIVGPAMKCSES